MKHLIGGYGTLLYQGSLNKSLKRELNDNNVIDYFPYYVKGYQRLFNLRAPHYKSSSKVSDKLIENSAANIRAVEGFSYNGLCFYVNDSELYSLDKRERYYDKVETVFYHFDTDEEIGKGYIYVSNEENRHLIFSSLKDLLPCWSDIQMARSGAYLISEEFGREYDSSTYLADGETLALDFYKAHGLENELIIK